MNSLNNQGVQFINWPVPDHVRACYTLRTPGHSLPPFDQFNLAHHVGDRPENVEQNRAALAAVTGRPLAWLSQVHGTRVVEAYPTMPVPEADASWTDKSDIAAVVMTADCLPVFFCDESGDRIAVAHAGWRGLCNGVLENTLAMVSPDGRPVHTWLGPAIGQKNYETSAEVRDAFLRQNAEAETCFQHSGREGHWLADLYGLARLRLKQAGAISVGGGDYCTYAESERFYSYRRELTTGRMANLIWKTLKA